MTEFQEEAGIGVASCREVFISVLVLTYSSLLDFNHV